MSDEEGVRSVQKHTILEDGELIMRSTEVFVLRDQLMHMNDEYIAQKKKLARIKLEAQLLNAKAEEKMAEWKVTANKTPEVQEALRKFGKEHVAMFFPHREDGDNDLYLAIISKEDAYMVEEKKRFDAITDTMIKITNNMEKPDEDK